MKRKVLFGTLAIVGASVAVAAAAKAVLTARRRRDIEGLEMNRSPRTRNSGVPSAAEDALSQHAEAEGWQTRDSATTFATENGRAYLEVPTACGTARLAANNNGNTFEATSYTNNGGRSFGYGSEETLPDEFAEPNLHYSTFLRLVEKHGLNNPAE